MDTATVLEGAATYLELYTWRQGDHRHGSDGLCAAEAVGCTPALTALQVALGGEPVPNVRGLPQIKTIVDWNDAPGRTKEEVIAMLRAVAMSERAREALPAAREVAHA